MRLLARCGPVSNQADEDDGDREDQTDVEEAALAYELTIPSGHGTSRTTKMVHSIVSTLLRPRRWPRLGQSNGYAMAVTVELASTGEALESMSLPAVRETFAVRGRADSTKGGRDSLVPAPRRGSRGIVSNTVVHSERRSNGASDFNLQEPKG
jgi:hypothetical protein